MNSRDDAHEVLIDKWLKKRLNDPWEHDFVINTRFIANTVAADIICQADLGRFDLGEEVIRRRSALKVLAGA